jgi:hypothetical protein
MRSRYKAVFFISLVFLILSACTSVQGGEATAQASVATSAAVQLATLVQKTLAARPTHTPIPPTATLTPTVLASDTPTVTPEANPTAQRPHYTLDIDFSYDSHYGSVNEQIVYTNTSKDPLSELCLMVEMMSYQGVFSLKGITWQDGQAVDSVTWNNVQARFPLRQPLQPGESIQLNLSYEFQLPSQSSLNSDRPLPIAYTARQSNLVDWFPFIPPYRSGEGWVAHPPSYYGEHLVYDLANFDVSLHFTDARKDLIVAASAAAQTDGDLLRYHLEGARTFALSIGSEYQTASMRSGNVEVTSYFFPMTESAGQAALKTSVEALELYQQLFGPYPHDTLAVVEADFLDGMEYDGLYFSSKAFYNQYNGKSEDFLVAIAAHETSHQWWFATIGNDQATEPWLDEALATYMEKLYYEHYAPDAVQWWWDFRVDYYHPTGWVDNSVYGPEGAAQTYQQYRNAVYLNGAHFLEDLRQAIGDDAFFAFLKDYATQYAGKIARTQDFFDVLRQHTQADLAPLMTKYFQTQH